MMVAKRLTRGCRQRKAFVPFYSRKKIFFGS